MDVARRKGYTGTYVHRLVCNKLGLQIHYNNFMRIFRPGYPRSARDEKIADCTVKIVKRLPDINIRSESFAAKAHSAGFTVSDVYRYYARTRDKPYSPKSFSQAVSRPMCRYEKAILKEAEECLTEMQRGASNAKE